MAEIAKGISFTICDIPLQYKRNCCYEIIKTANYFGDYVPSTSMSKQNCKILNMTVSLSILGNS